VKKPLTKLAWGYSIQWMRLRANFGKFFYKTFLRILPCVLIAFLSTAGLCGRVGEGKTVVRMTIWGTDAEEPLKELAREYETLHPDRHIEIELQTGQSYDIWMTIQLISGNPPQIMQSQWYWSWTFGHKGKLLQVDPILERVNPYTGKRWIDQFYKARLDSVRDPQGRLFIIPHDQVKTAMFYNKNIFRKLNLTPPKTWHEFMQLCQRIEDAGYIPIGVAGVSTTGIIEWNVNVFFDSVYRDEVSQLDVLHPDGFVDLEETIRGYRKGIINPLDEQYKEIWRIFKSWSCYWQKGFVSASETDVSRLFLDSRCVMVMDGVWRVKYLKLDIEDLPKEKQFESTPWLSGIGWCRLCDTHRLER